MAAAWQNPSTTGFAQKAQAGTPSDNLDPPRWTVSIPVTVASAVYLGFFLRYAFKSWLLQRRCRGSYFFSLEAALAILAVATGIDITARAPKLGVFDHLVKLSNIHLSCVTMHLSLPTIGKMEDVAVVLFLVSLAVTLFNLLATAVTYGWSASDNDFVHDYRLSSIVMVLVFCILVSHSLATTYVRGLVGYRHAKKQRKIMSSFQKDCKHVKCTCFSSDELKMGIIKSWVMAVTSNPDRCLRSSGMPLVSAVLCWGVNGFALLLRVTYLMLRCSNCRADWSRHSSSFWNSVPVIVFLIQYAAILVGLVASMARGLNTNPFASSSEYDYSFNRYWHSLFYVRYYRLGRVMSWKEVPLFPRKSPRESIIATVTYDIVIYWVLRKVQIFSVNLLIYFDLGVIVMTNMVLLILSVAGQPIFKLLSSAHKLDRVGLAEFDSWQATPATVNSRPRQGGHSSKYDHFRRSILTLSPVLSAKQAPLGSWVGVPEDWIKKGAGRKPRRLRILLEECNDRFKTASDIYMLLDRVMADKTYKKHGFLKKPPPCRTLVIVILTKLFCGKFIKSHPKKVRSLMREVGEGIRFTRMVDQYPKRAEDGIPYGVIKTGEPMLSCIAQADHLWEGMMIAVGEEGFDMEKWLRSDPVSSENLKYLFNLLVIEPKLMDEGRPSERDDYTSVKEVIDDLQVKIQHSETSRREETIAWLIELAYVSRLYYRQRGRSTFTLTTQHFERSRKVLADFIGECLTDLPFVIIRSCIHAPYGAREEKVQQAANMLGELEDVLKRLESIHN